MIFFENIEAQLEKTIQFKNEVDNELKEKTKEVERLAGLLEEKERMIVKEREEYVVRVRALEDNLMKVITAHSQSQDDEEKDMLFNEISRLRVCMESK